MANGEENLSTEDYQAPGTEAPIVTPPAAETPSEGNETAQMGGLESLLTGVIFDPVEKVASFVNNYMPTFMEERANNLATSYGGLKDIMLEYARNPRKAVYNITIAPVVDLTDMFLLKPTTEFANKRPIYSVLGSGLSALALLYLI